MMIKKRIYVKKHEIGYADLEIYSHPFDFAFVRWMEIAPKYQGKGYGKNLVRKIKKYILDENLVGICLDSTPAHLSKINEDEAFFEKCGLEKVFPREISSKEYFFNKKEKTINQIIHAFMAVEQ